MELPVIALCAVSPLHVGGAETNMLQIAKHLRHKYQILIIGPMTSTFEERAHQIGIRTVSLPMASKFSFTTVLRLANIFKKENIQLVHTHDTRGGLLGRVAAKIVGVKAIHTVHIPAIFQTDHPLKRRIYSSIERFLNNRFSRRVIFVSESVMKICSAGVAPDNSVLIPNGINVRHCRQIYDIRSSFRNEFLRRYGISDKGTIISWAGRMTQQKGLDNLIEAARLLKDYPIRYLLIGDGPERGDIESLINKFEMRNQFILMGTCQPDEVYRLLALSDIFVLPSRYENFPYAILEAMALGLPCVVTDVGGNKELVEDGVNGFVVVPHEPEKFGNAIQGLLDNLELRRSMAENSLELVKKYDEKFMIEKVEEIYHLLLD